MDKSACYVNHSNDVELARRNVEKYRIWKIEKQKWKLEKQKLEGRKTRNQDNFSCQSSKLKIRNVANNYEK